MEKNTNSQKQNTPLLYREGAGVSLDFAKMGGLVPAIIQDADTKTVLMLGYMNKEALDKKLGGEVLCYIY